MVFLLLCRLCTLATSCLGGNVPHPAVARIIVPERTATSYGTGTLIDVRDQYALVITNWHVVRDGTGPPEVVFPNGFRSQARPLKLDSNWDLAALVIWRPPIEPVKISREPPRPGERLTICGYGQGDYRAVTGRCTQYFAPGVDYPHELVELSVEARQGDSGGPIFNQRGELAGVLFGAGRGTTMGSYGGRVHAFLASLAPDIGRTKSQRVAQLLPPQPVTPASAARGSVSSHLAVGDDSAVQPSATISASINPSRAAGRAIEREADEAALAADQSTDRWTASNHLPGARASEAAPAELSAPLAAVGSSPPPAEPMSWTDIAGKSWLSQAGTLLAILGGMALVMQIAKLASS